MDREDYTKVMGEIEKLRNEVHAELLQYHVALSRLRQDVIDVTGIMIRNIHIDIKNLTKEEGKLE